MLTASDSVPPTNPLVTMIVLCYNQARFVVETLESVKAQTYKHTELIIIDDYSTDDSVAVIERWLRENNDVRCTFIPHEKNQGICKSLNEALARTSGKYISMIASDDIWLAEKIERQVAVMESQPDSVGVIYSDAFRIDENGNLSPETYIGHYWKLQQMPQGHIFETLLQFNFIPGPTTLIRRACYGKVGLYDEHLPWEDWDMWLRIARYYSFAFSPTPSVKYRVHSNSLSHSDPDRLLGDSCKVLTKQFTLGNLTRDQATTLTKTLLKWSEHLYKANDAQAPDVLLALSNATHHKRASWMYRFVRLGLSFGIWQKAYNIRSILVRARRFV